jgi:hypothetical protein
LGKFLEGLGMEKVGMYSLWPFSKFYGYLVHLWPIGIKYFSPVWVHSVKKNLATLFVVTS